MRQQQLILTLNDRGNRARREIYRRNQPLAEWWFRRIRASLESVEAEEPRSGPSPGQAQEIFRWR